MSVTPAGAVVWVDGPDSTAFLHGLLSNDVAGMDEGQTLPALLLDATGHIRVVLRVHRTAADAYTLITDAALGEGLAQLLEQYHFSEDLEIIGPEPVDVVTLTSPDVDGADLVVPGWLPGTFDAIGQATAMTPAAGTAADPADAEAARIAAGVPRFGVDIGPRTLVHEAGLEHTAVSFDKGCYLGQETVSRVEHRGGVRRRLRGLRLARAVEPGAEVTYDGRTVGAVSSVAVHATLGAIALATLRTEVPDGSSVAVSGSHQPAAVVSLPFEHPPVDRTAPDNT